jgi:hypothetical protein
MAEYMVYEREIRNMYKMISKENISAKMKTMLHEGG